MMVYRLGKDGGNVLRMVRKELRLVSRQDFGQIRALVSD
jgi:hypothetical protein